MSWNAYELKNFKRQRKLKFFKHTYISVGEHVVKYL